jgi:hypothetical protein
MRLKGVRTLAVGSLLAAFVMVCQRPVLGDTQVTMQLTGELTGDTMGGVYTSPYQITVDGHTADLLACDDFETDINVDDKWYANMFPLTEVADPGPGPQKFGTTSVTLPAGDSQPSETIAVNATQAYDAAAWLAYEILTLPGGTSSAVYGEYSYALWQVFDPNAYLGYNNNHLNPTELAGVREDMDEAFYGTTTPSNYNTLNISSVPSDYTVYIYTPVDKSESGYIYPSQEFLGIVKTPEAATLGFLLFDFLGLAGILFLARRRFAVGPTENSLP